MELCRLCLDLQSDKSFSALEGTFKEMVQVVVPELNLEISDAPVVCKECSNNLDNFFLFKSKCFENEKEIKLKCDGRTRKCGLKDLLHGGANSECSYLKIEKAKERVCRTCMGSIECESYTILKPSVPDPYLDSMITMCFLEMDLELTEDPVMCETCLENLQKLHHFKSACLATEDKLVNFCKTNGTNSKGKISLLSVLEFDISKNSTDPEFLYIKSEQLNEQSTDVIMKTENHLQVADPIGPMVGEAGLKQEEVDIKSEDGIGGGDSENEESVDLVSTTERKIFSCLQCSYQSTQKRYLAAHIKRIHEKRPQESSQKERLFTKEGVSDFCCVECNYQTTQSRYLRAHIRRIHRKNEEVVFNCLQCAYNSRDKQNLEVHIKLTHKQTDSFTRLKKEKVVLKCQQCNHPSLTKRGFDRHFKRLHEKDGKLKGYTFGCPHCKYQSTEKKDIRPHVWRVHKKLIEVDKRNIVNIVSNVKAASSCDNELKRKQYICTRCSHRVSTKDQLVNHLFKRHGIVEEGRKVYECEICYNFATILKHLLKYHVEKVHKKTKSFECDQCSFSTKYLKGLIKHQNNAHIPKAFVCSDCSFMTFDHDSYKYHRKTSHLLTCTFCHFKTHYFITLVRHEKRKHRYQYFKGRTGSFTMTLVA